MIRWWPLLAGCTGPAGPGTTPPPPSTTPTGDTALVSQAPVQMAGMSSERLGTALAWLPGPARLAVGCPGSNDYEEASNKAVYVTDPLLQPPDEVRVPQTALRVERGDWLWTSHVWSYSAFGREILVPGDVTRDGLDDIVVFDWSDISDAGAWLFPGPLDDDSPNRLTWRDGIPLPGVPWRGTPCGDLNDDGHDELCTAMGIALSPIHLPVAAWDVTWSVVGDGSDVRIASGDLDGDGVREVLITEPDAATVHRLVSPPPGEHDLAALATSSWQAPSDPVALHGDADLDGDGRRDLMVAWSGDDPAVAVSTTLSGDLATAAIRIAVEAESLTAGDLDGDDQDDLVIGRSGDVLVFMGPLTPGVHTEADADNVLTGRASLDDRSPSFGATVLAADMDGDGDAELAVGHPGAQSSNGNVPNGHVFVFHDPHTFRWVVR